LLDRDGRYPGEEERITDLVQLATALGLQPPPPSILDRT
jgi:hypothetical protein